jgi:hypothetical protein
MTAPINTPNAIVVRYIFPKVVVGSWKSLPVSFHPLLNTYLFRS